MKKRLEADLISIAHRILQLKNKSDVNQLYLETQKLYEKLAVLRFVDEHFGDVKPTIGIAEMENKIERIFDKEEVLQAEIKVKNQPIIEEKQDEAIVEIPKEKELLKEQLLVDETVEAPEKEIEPSFKLSDEDAIVIKEDKSFINIPVDAIKEEIKPDFELNEGEEIVIKEEDSVEETPIASVESQIKPTLTMPKDVKTEEPHKKEAVQISFEELLGGNYIDTQFVKIPSSEKKAEVDAIEKPASIAFQPEIVTAFEDVTLEKEEPKSVTLNEKLAKGINIGLNDRIAFVKHLFGGNNEDYNRVLNQLITLDTFQETKAFIDEMVKPDYNNWDGKEEYESRFMEIIEKKFLSF
jgi:hypothetical protein